MDYELMGMFDWVMLRWHDSIIDPFNYVTRIIPIPARREAPRGALGTLYKLQDGTRVPTASLMPRAAGMNAYTNQDRYGLYIMRHFDMSVGPSIPRVVPLLWYSQICRAERADFDVDLLRPDNQIPDEVIWWTCPDCDAWEPQKPKEPQSCPCRPGHCQWLRSTVYEYARTGADETVLR